MKSSSLITNGLQSRKVAIVATFFLRLSLGLTIFLMWSYFRPFVYASIPTKQIQALYGMVSVYQSPPWDGIITAWLRWDAVHYINIAQFGYRAHSVGASVFYPLYPFLIRLVASIVSHNYLLSALSVSTMACISYLAGFFRLTNELLGGQVAKWSLFAILCYPFSIFLIAPYSESLFLAFTIWMFIAAKQKSWTLTALLGFASGLTRGPAILSSFALLWLFLIQEEKHKIGTPLKMLENITVALTPFLGGGTFLLWRYLQGYPSISQVLWDHGIELTNPLVAITSAIFQWIKVRDFYTTIDILSAALFLLLFLIIYKKRTIPFCFIVYYGCNLFLFLSKVHHDASSLQSMSRYGITLFPAFWVLGEWLTNRTPLLRFILLAVSFGLLSIFSGLYAIWVFIG